MAVAIVVALFVSTVTTACLSYNDDNEAKRKAMDAVATQIQTALAQHPGVIQAEVVYQDNIDTPGSTLVSVGVKPGTDPETVVDDAVRLVWQSKLNPLHSISINVSFYQSDQRGTSKVIDPIKDKAELQAKYGPRPT